MKMLFIGGLYAKEYEDFVLKDCKRGDVAMPSNVYQWGVLEGLVANGIDVKVISFPYLPGYPQRYSKLYSPQMPINLDENKLGEMKRYCTFFLIKDLSVYFRMFHSIKRYLKTELSSPDEEVYIISYSPYVPQILPAVSFKKKYPNLKVCCIITDLFYNHFSQLKGVPFLKKIQYAFEIFGVQKSLPRIDSFVILAKKMEELVPICKGRNIVIEGIAKPREYIAKTNESPKIKTLLYTGSLGCHTSIKELVLSFMKTTNPDFRLCICGDGDYRVFVEECQNKDSRIVYKGIVDHETSLSLQHESTALINPRFPSIRDTPYSFPSKTMEYMMSGTPMIGYKLDGIPQEYYNYYYTIDEESINGLYRSIEYVLSKPQFELNEMALKAYNFVRMKKTANVQMKRLISFLAYRD